MANLALPSGASNFSMPPKGRRRHAQNNLPYLVTSCAAPMIAACLFFDTEIRRCLNNRGEIWRFRDACIDFLKYLYEFATEPPRTIESGSRLCTIMLSASPRCFPYSMKVCLAALWPFPALAARDSPSSPLLRETSHQQQSLRQLLSQGSSPPRCLSVCPVQGQSSLRRCSALQAPHTWP